CVVPLCRAPCLSAAGSGSPDEVATSRVGARLGGIPVHFLVGDMEGGTPNEHTSLNHCDHAAAASVVRLVSEFGSPWMSDLEPRRRRRHVRLTSGSSRRRQRR